MNYKSIFTLLLIPQFFIQLNAVKISSADQKTRIFSLIPKATAHYLAHSNNLEQLNQNKIVCCSDGTVFLAIKYTPDKRTIVINSFISRPRKYPFATSQRLPIKTFDRMVQEIKNLWSTS